MIQLSVVIVTYNRSHLLMETVRSVRSALKELPFTYELIIADDCSAAEHRTAIDSIQNAVVVRTPRNLGLGANVNNGLSRVQGRLVLQIQDDWNCVDSNAIMTSINFLSTNSDVGIVQLTKVASDLPAEVRTAGGETFQVFANDRLPWIRHCGVRPYADNPHVKRREFMTDIGTYLERVPMTTCENDYKRRVARQSRWRVAMRQGTTCFVHVGGDVSLNSGGRRHPLVKALHALPLGRDWIEPALRRFAISVDHIAARIASGRWLSW